MDEFVTLMLVPPVLFSQLDELVVVYQVEVSAKVILVKLLQDRNALSPIDVTLSGIVNEVFCFPIAY